MAAAEGSKFPPARYIYKDHIVAAVAQVDPVFASTLDLASVAGISTSRIEHLGQSVALLLSGLTSQQFIPTDEALTRAFLEWLPHAKFYESAIKGAPRPVNSRLRIAPVMSCGLIVVRYQPDRAAHFWRDVAHQQNMATESGQYRLVEMLRKRGDKLTYGQRVRWVMACWNFFWEGADAPREMKPLCSLQQPLRFLGTPLDGSGPVIYAPTLSLADAVSRLKLAKPAIKRQERRRQHS